MGSTSGASRGLSEDRPLSHLVAQPWLLQGHLSEGVGVGARFPKMQGQTSAPSQMKPAGTMARREGAI